MSHLISTAGHLIRISGHLANNENCCKDCIDCETNCDTGTRPPTFDIQVDHGFWYTDPASCQYDLGGTDTSPYGGSFELQWLGASDGLCRWYYCGDDPCDTGKKFIWTLAYYLPDVILLTIWYSADIADCDRQTVLDYIQTGPTGFNTFSKSGQTETDCCLIDVTDIPYLGSSGGLVTITGGALYIDAQATGC